MISVVLINGLISSGKDTVADILVEHKGYKKFSLASSLKKNTSKKYCFEEELCYTQDGKRSVVKSAGKTVRELLIIESEQAKKIDECVFVDKCVLEILSQECEKIVISDFRFPHEYRGFVSKFGSNVKTARVIRRGVVAQPLHSEHQLDTFFFGIEIFNDSTLEDLVDKIIKEDFF